MDTKRKKIFVDSSTGGRGDIWMRLVGYYAFAVIKPKLEFHIYLPQFLRQLAIEIFGDRLHIMTDEEAAMQPMLSYTGLGIRHLMKGILKGQRYIASFQRTVFNDKKERRFKDYLNWGIFWVADVLGFVLVPPSRWSRTWHGYMELVPIKDLRNVDYDTFKVQVEKDYPVIYGKLNGTITLSPEFSVPADMKDNLIIFPTGSSKQFVPLDWAVSNFPNAYYAFFHLDKDMKRFSDKGLKTVPFYKEAGDIVALSKAAKWTISSDSFQSHVLQTANEKTTIAITEVIKERVINPSFRGKVVDSVVACHPCLHATGSLYCDAGFTECQNWWDKIYTANMIRSVELS
jgi:hypothetical protein